MTATYPFTAVIGADQMQLALLLSAVAPEIGGVLVRGEKGTAKSTAVRALADLLPPIDRVRGCRFACDPAAPEPGCPDGPHEVTHAERHRPPLVELPVGASEDRVVGSLDLERALGEGVHAFRPGLLAAAHRGVLYVDEVNLLGDHLVDVLLDAAAMGRNHVERDGVSVEHPARFVLIGSMNPEEGELRPQLLDRFGLVVDVAASREPALRVEVVRRRLAADADPDGFARRWSGREQALATRIAAARDRLGDVTLGDEALLRIAEICAAFDVDGMRADIVIARTAVAHAAWCARTQVTEDDIRVAARLALPHRRRRTPFDQPDTDDARLDEILDRGTDTPPPARSAAGDEPDGDEPDGDGSDGDGPDGDGPDGDGPDGDGPDGGGGDGDGPGTGDRRDGGSAASPGADDAPAPGPRTGPSPRAESSDAATPETAGRPTPPTRPAGRARSITGRGGRRAAPGRRAAARTDAGRVVGVHVDPGAGGPVHLFGTLTAAAPLQAQRGRTDGPMLLVPGDLRRARRRGRESNLVLFVVDASGSMAARTRMDQVKAAVLSLLVDAYQRRDRVALIAFRGQSAQIVLPPTRSVEFAARRLDALVTGGRTPIAAGLAAAARMIATEQVREPLRRPLVLLLTDGRGDNRAAVSAAVALRGHDMVVVDCEAGPVRLGLARRLAVDLGADHVSLHDVTERTAA